MRIHNPDTTARMLSRRALCSLPLSLTGLVLTGRQAQAQISGMGDAINKAGRQRMLSQRMSKAWMSMGLGVQTEYAGKVLEQSMAIFDRQLAELKAFAPTAEIRGTYQQMEAEWFDYKSVLIVTTPSLEQAKLMLGHAGKVLASAHKSTVLLEQYSGKPGAKLINVAGRQRMLSQRMAQFYLAVQWNIDNAASQRELAKAREEFVPALEVLRNAPEATEQIKQELVLVDNQWLFFDNALKARATGQKAAADVFVTSENMLQVMDRVTSMYSRILG